MVSDFEQKTGIKVETQTITSCTDSSGYAYHELRVFASSAQRMNRTAIQCAAQRKSPSFSDYYSYFAVLLVKGRYCYNNNSTDYTQSCLHVHYTCACVATYLSIMITKHMAYGLSKL